MITYFEYSEYIVESGKMPAKICFVIDREHDSRMFRVLAMADRAYSIKGNVLTEIKNRNSEPSTTHISDEDKVVLKLKAVLI
jgi:hypothetical protein